MLYTYTTTIEWFCASILFQRHKFYSTINTGENPSLQIYAHTHLNWVGYYYRPLNRINV